MTTSNSIVSSQGRLPTEKQLKGRGNKIVVGTVVKAKSGELEEEVSVVSSRRMRKELTGVFQGFLGRRRFLVRFQNRSENNFPSNQLTVVTAHEILLEEAPKVSTIPEITEDNAGKQKG